ncbi:hypothetical protein IFM89_034570 [Coptis chinensis]|uniref:DUF659 domain-containing protein n=1 Tax=Coptis chinensis TaxID=261450 RepID=A0A835HS40_9MAGN|nr:hypothetical protein IFM89_034570 [Coptis chinensis]
MKIKWSTYGVTVMCDSWTGPTRQCLMNFMVYCAGLMTFDLSVDLSKHKKDHRHLLKHMRRVVDKVGKENVVQIVTDNGVNFKKTGEMLARENVQSPNDTQLDGETYYDPDAWRMPSDGDHDNAYNVVDDDNDSNDDDHAQVRASGPSRGGGGGRGDGSGPSRVGGGGPPGFDYDHAQVRASGPSQGGGSGRGDGSGPSRVGGGGPPSFDGNDGVQSQQRRVSIGGGVGSQRVTAPSAHQVVGVDALLLGLNNQLVVPHSAVIIEEYTLLKRMGLTMQLKTLTMVLPPNEDLVKEKVDKGEQILHRAQTPTIVFMGKGHLLWSRYFSYVNPQEEYSRSQYYGNWNDPQACSTTSTYATPLEQYVSLSFMEIGMLYLTRWNERDQSMEDVQPFSDHSVDMPPPAWGTVWEPMSRPIVEETGYLIIGYLKLCGKNWISQHMTCTWKTLRIGSAKPSLGTSIVMIFFLNLYYMVSKTFKKVVNHSGSSLLYNGLESQPLLVWNKVKVFLYWMSVFYHV